MGTATILGTEYQTVDLPNGSTWMAEDLNWSGAGIVGTYGRLYTFASIASVNFGGWRVPTPDEMSAMVDSVPGCRWRFGGTSYTSLGPEYLKSIDDWTPTSGDNASGLNVFPGGLSPSGTPVNVGIEGGFLCSLLDESNYDRFLLGVAGEPAKLWLAGNDPYIQRQVANPAYGYQVRLIYDPPTMVHILSEIGGEDECVFSAAPERGYEPKITPSIEWNELPSGLFRAIDDGAAYDAHDAEITVYVTTAEISAFETFYLAHRAETVKYQCYDGVYPFGPHITVGATGVDVQIISWENLGRVGTKADLWQLNLSMRLQQGYTPTAPTGVPALFGTKYASPSWALKSIPHLTDDGRSNITSRNQGATKTCQVVADNFSTVEAAEIVNWCLFTRSGSFSYSPATGLYPFGASMGDGPFTCRLIGWTVQKPTPSRWDFTFTLSIG